MNDVEGHAHRPNCPAVETLAAYVDGRLTAVERQAVETHVAACETCYQVLADTARVAFDEAEDEIAGQPAPGVAQLQPAAAGAVPSARARATSPKTSRESAATPGRTAGGAAWWIAAAAGIALLAGATLYWTWSTGRGDRPELAALVAASDSYRAYESRLTGGFVHVPLPAVTRSGDDGRRVPPEVRLAAARIEEGAGQDQAPQTLAALGAARFLSGDLDGSIGALERAVASTPAQAPYVSDLAAAYLARARAQGKPDEAARAADLATRALDLAGGPGRLPEAQFNLALALETTGRSEEARAAWRAYLSVDADSPWAVEARARLAALGD